MVNVNVFEDKKNRQKDKLKTICHRSIDAGGIKIDGLLRCGSYDQVKLTRVENIVGNRLTYWLLEFSLFLHIVFKSCFSVLSFRMVDKYKP